MKWTQQQAIELCQSIERVCVPFGCHVALTGGCLYKVGERKDCDVLFYRIRQTPRIDVDGLLEALEGIGMTTVSGFGWCYKFEFQGRNVDALFPEEEGGQYEKPVDKADLLQVLP